MGCVSSKTTDESTNIRPRRLSQLLHEENNQNDVENSEKIVDESSFNAIRILSGNRRASYFSQDIDPRAYISDHAFVSLNGLESGKIKTNQDRTFVHMSSDCCIFGVFDGHGRNGHLCSSFLKKHLASTCIKHLHSNENTSQALIDCFQELEDAMISDGFDCKFSGTTATVVLVTNGKLYTAWVGDSPGFIVAYKDKRLQARDLITIHNFDDAKESERIGQAGGKIARFKDAYDFVGPLRAFFPSLSIPGLAMSRSLGDTMSKKIGIISVPDTRVQNLDEDDRFIFLCSDGLTEFLTSDTIVSDLSKDGSLHEACHALSNKAQKRWKEEEADSSDDISCLVVQLCVL